MPTINYNAALPPDIYKQVGVGSINIGSYINSLKVNLNSLITLLFANSEQGFTQTLDDYSILFQDAAGTTALTGVGQTLGLVLDKSKGGIGATRRNLLAYSEDFSNSAWSKFGTVYSLDSNGYKITNTSSGGYINQTPAATSTSQIRTATFVIGIASKFVGLKVASVVNGANQAGVVVDTTNKIITATTSAGTGYSVLSSSIQALPNGTIKVVITTQGPSETQRVVMNSVASSNGVTVGSVGDYFYIINTQLENGSTATPYQKVTSQYGGWVDGNHSYQTTSSMRPLLQDSPRRIQYDGIDDKLTTTLPTQLTGCTVIRAIPNVGCQIQTNQPIGPIYEDSINHCGLIVINRALTAYETSLITKLFNKLAGV